MSKIIEEELYPIEKCPFLFIDEKSRSVIFYYNDGIREITDILGLVDEEGNFEFNNAQYVQHLNDIEYMSKIYPEKKFIFRNEEFNGFKKYN